MRCITLFAREVSRRIVGLTLLLAATLAWADQVKTPTDAAIAATEQQWYSVHLDGRKIGSMLSHRIATEQTVETRQQLSLILERSGETLRMESVQSMIETPAGEPIRFSNLLDMGGGKVAMHGDVANAVAKIRLAQGGSESEQQIAWPTGALLAEGQRLAALRAGNEPGTRYTYTIFDLDALQPMQVSTNVLGMQELEVAGHTVRLLALKQRLEADGSITDSELWVQPSDYLVRRMRMPMLGVFLDAVACDRACAEAPNQPIDILAATSASSPRSLSTRDRQRRLRYSLKLLGPPPSLEPVPGQSASTSDEGMQITVDPMGGVDRPPEAKDLQANRWLQSDNIELIDLAKIMAGETRSASDVMRRLQSGVATHIKTKSLRIGYASALEAARLGEGDCTEHALLLAALGRSQGIPTRVASGLAYVPSFAGKRDVFVPHAWVYAWVDGRWQGYDAALSGFDSGHLALDVGDGDPFSFYAGLNLLGQLSISEIKRAKR